MSDGMRDSRHRAPSERWWTTKAIFDLLAKPPLILGPWTRTATKSVRESPDLREYRCYECGTAWATA